jgi:hypothetical protein
MNDSTNVIPKWIPAGNKPGYYVLNPEFRKAFPNSTNEETNKDIESLRLRLRAVVASRFSTNARRKERSKYRKLKGRVRQTA